ncbi:MAG: heavy-metal-associated domain-containing protein [archaeon]
MKTKLNVKGMHCSSCEMLINESLTDLGVDASTVSWNKGTVEVSFDEKKVSLQQVKDAIKKEGYQI